MMALDPRMVFCAPVPGGDYGVREGPVPELTGPVRITAAVRGVRALFASAGLDAGRYGSPDWNPLGDLISHNDRVVLKPNWVHHHNRSGAGLECLVTHTTVIEAVVRYVAKAAPRLITVCDAPIQACDFDALMAAAGVRDMIERLSVSNIPVTLKDLRRTIRTSEELSEKPRDANKPVDDYVLYDLGADSHLEPITSTAAEFRVTMYDPDLLKRRHAPGRHQYLIARDVIDADVVINLPKLKTHKKSCITAALKNVVGINGHKEYLPHHRKGGEGTGDCYPGRSVLRGFVEDALDAANRAERRLTRKALSALVVSGMALGKLLRQGDTYDGSWHGNDTVWRMALDLQRILFYGTHAGTLDAVPQRKVMTITDAIVAGEGEGPLSPTPVDLGLLTMGTNVAAVEWVHAVLMGLDPNKIPLVREAFRPWRHALAAFGPDEIVVHVDGETLRHDVLFRRYGRAFRLPPGWAGHAEAHRAMDALHVVASDKARSAI